jgi:hypothetical protein
MSTSTDRELPSIHELSPEEEGGRIARAGFAYQDHVAAEYCLKMLTNNKLGAVWVERHDDLVGIWTNGDEEVEFVQVKHENRDVLYSTANIDDILEKSLKRSRCKEETWFTIYTSQDVKSELRVLTRERDNEVREDGEVAELCEELIERHPGLEAKDGTRVTDWVNRCRWIVGPRNKEMLATKNKSKLYSILENQGIVRKQIDVIYEKILGIIYEKSTKQREYSIESEWLIEWLENELSRILAGSSKDETLAGKLEDANVGGEVEKAQRRRTKYIERKIDTGYSGTSEISTASVEILAELDEIKSLMFMGEIEEGEHTYRRCIVRIGKLLDNKEEIGKNISKAEAQGCMFLAVSRCMFDFVR